MMPTIAFFGATGDSAGYALAHTLKAGYECRALARTPAKLTESMKAKGVEPETLDKHLTIINGDIRDVEAVKKVLSLEDGSGRVVEKYVVGIGAYPKFQWSLWNPFPLSDPTICQSACTTILSALRDLHPPTKPLAFNILTTGIHAPGRVRDVPLLIFPLYKYLGQDAHGDKGIVEKLLAEAMKKPETERILAGFVNVKPSLLLDGAGKGLEHVRVGVEERPAIGYSIQRGDVGLFIFEKLVLGEKVPVEWLGKGVSMTY